MFKQFFILLATSGIFLISACSQDTNSPEVQIKNMVSAMETAVEQRSLDSVKELVDSEYKDEWNGNRRAAHCRHLHSRVDSHPSQGEQ